MLQLEMAAYCLEIFDEALAVERGGISDECRPSGAALVVEEKRVSRGEWLQVGGQVVHGEPWTAVKDNDRVAPAADRSIEQANAAACVDVSVASRNGCSYGACRRSPHSGEADHHDCGGDGPGHLLWLYRLRHGGVALPTLVLERDRLEGCAGVIGVQVRQRLIL